MYICFYIFLKTYIQPDERILEMLRKMLSLLLCVVLTFTTITTRAIFLDNRMLTDIDSHWAEKDILTLNRLGILNGSSNQANPDSFITRGEFTALIARSLELEITNPKEFNDVNSDNIFYNDISAASSHGIINGMNDGNFYPENKITREEIMLIISRCIDSSDETIPDFKDIDKNYKYLQNLSMAVASGIISGYSDGTFKPKNNATRAESAVMIVRLLKAENSANAEKIKAFSRKYIRNDMDDISININSSVGRALEEAESRQNGIILIENHNVFVEKVLKNLTLIAFKNEGLLSQSVYKGDITYITKYSDNTEAKNNYNCEITLDMIFRNNTLYVYNYNLNLRKNEKINLTWEVYSTPPEYSPKGVNVISPSSFHISSENLNVDSTALTDELNFFNALTQNYINYARSSNYDVWPMYKTDFTLKTSNDFLNNVNARQKAIELLVKYACKYKIHGINFDFENIHTKNRDVLTKHVREVSLVLHEMGLVVSVDITRKEPTSSTWSMCYNRDALAETADYIMLMAYDEHYAGSKTPGSVASLDWTEEAIKLTLKEVTPEKLILGIPFYMRYWETKNGKITVSRAISMQTAYDLIRENEVSYTWIEEDGQYRISWKKGISTSEFWLENSDTIKKRVELANKYNLSGIASWRRGLEISNAWNIIEENLR